MQIQEIKFSLLSIPTNPTRSSATEIAAGRSDKITTLVVQIKTKSGIEGIGFAYSLQGGGKAMLALGQEDLAPILINENALDNEKLAAKVYWRTQTIGRTGLISKAKLRICPFINYSEDSENLFPLISPTRDGSG